MIHPCKSPPARPDPGLSRSGRWGIGTASGCDPIRMAFPALVSVVAALLTFALLQSTRIAMFDGMRSELRAGQTHVYPVATIARYSGWLYGAQNSRPLYMGSLDGPFPTLWKYAGARPHWAARTALWACGLFFAASGAVWIALVTLTGQPRVLPFRLSKSERLRTAQHALRLARPWYIGAAILIAAATWYAGFDREGWRMPLAEGLAPTPLQLACIAGVWSILTCLFGLAFLKPSAASVAPELFERALCQRCGYSIRGLVHPICPECGRGVELANVPSLPGLWNIHGRLARLSGIALCAATMLLAMAWAIGPSVRSWILLQPQSPFVRPSGGWLAEGEHAQIWKTTYGLITVIAIRETHTANDPAWTVSWEFAPRSGSTLHAATGTLRIPVSFGSAAAADLHIRELPCGPLGFYSIRNDPRLHVAAPNAIFSDMGDWGRPIPQAVDAP